MLKLLTCEKETANKTKDTEVSIWVNSWNYFKYLFLSAVKIKIRIVFLLTEGGKPERVCTLTGTPAAIA